MEKTFYVGTAGWSIPAHLKTTIAGKGTHLQRYAQVFNAVEINSSFYREHKFATYAKWAASVPDNFRFSVKLSRHFTHHTKLQQAGSRLTDVLSTIAGLGPKWSLLLMQLPPKLEFDRAVTISFFSSLQRDLERFAMLSGQRIEIVIEPRNKTWSSAPAIETMANYGVSKVLADPEPCRLSKSLRVQVEENIRYLRHHGTPDVYKSRYPPEIVKRIARSMAQPLSDASQSWCIFDNTTFGHATENALELKNQFR